MSEVLRVLLVEDSENDAGLVVHYLHKAGYEVRAGRVEAAGAMREALTGGVWDVIIADYRLPHFDAPGALSVLHGTGLDIPFIVVSGTIGEEIAVAMMKAGANDYLMKDDLARLAPAVTREIREARVRQEKQRTEQSLEQSEHRYQSLFRHMLNGFTYCQMLYDEQQRPVDFITLETNEAFERITGLRDVVGRRVSEVLPGLREAMPEFFEMQGRVALTGVPERFELNFQAIGRWLSVSVYSPEKTYFVAVFDDITDRKREEQSREATVTLLRIINSPSDTRELLRSATGLLQTWSGCEAVGVRLRQEDDYPYYESRGSPPEFVEGDKYLCVRQPNGEPVRDIGGCTELECLCGDLLCSRFDPRWLTADGTFWTNHFSREPVRSGQGERRARNWCSAFRFESTALVPLRYAGRTLGLLQFHDTRPERFRPELIAQLENAAASLAIALVQRQTVDALRASEERYRLISENTADVIWLLDWRADRVTYVSPSVKRLLGYSPDELTGKPARATLTPESYKQIVGQGVAKAVAAYKAGRLGPALVQQVDQVRKDGEIVRTEVSITLLPNAREILGVTRDITERTHTEAKLMQAQKLESIGRLAGGVAHDFNNLLTVINGYSSLVLRKLGPRDSLRDYVAEIKAAGERAAALTAQLLMLSRKQLVEPRLVNLNNITLEVARMLGRVIGEDIRLESNLSDELDLVMADPGQLHQVLMNLAVNARDAMPSGGVLRIATANAAVGQEEAEISGIKPGRYVVLRVSDNGVGMTEDELTHLFEPFFTTKKVGEGTGLGLATVYGIVEQCHGSITVTSAQGQGTTFTIHLPAAVGEVGPAERGSMDDAALHGSETLLVVEDQGQVRRMTADVLRGCGYQVIEAADAAEALLQSERYADPIHLLVSDIVMPGLSGRELARRLKPLRPNMEILFISGYHDRAERDKEPLEGAYLAKPFSPAELARKVREVLGPARPYPSQ